MDARRRWLLVALVAALAAAAWWRCAARGDDRTPAPAASAARGPGADDADRVRRVEAARRGLVPALPARAIEGRVVDEAGAPVADAEVVLARPARHARSDRDGRFRFDGLAEGTYVVEARAGDAYAGPVKARAAGAPVVLRLYPAGRVEVACVSATTGAALAGARAGVRMHSMFPGAVDLEARTDARGVAVFRGMPGAGLEAWCAADGHALRARFVDATQEGAWRVTLELEAGTPVRGLVVDERGGPVADATIEVAASNLPALAGVTGAVRSDRHGRFVLPGVAPGRWVIHAAHPGHDLGMTPVDVPAGGEPPEVTIVVGDGVTIAGVVATRALAPAPGATVEVRFRDGGRTFRTVQADGTGRFEARGLPHDALQVVALHGRAASPPALVDPRAGAPAELLLVLEDDATIRGVVLAPDGRPAPDVSIFYVHDTRDDDRATAAGVEVTGEDGRFELGGLATDGAYVLTAMRPGQRAAVSLAMRSVGVRARAGEEVTIRLPATGGIRGRVTIADGGPPPPELRVRLGGTPQRLGADGGFLIEDLPPEVHDVRVDGGDLLEVVIRGVEVRAGEVTDVGELRLARGRRVRGTVRDADDRPVAGAAIRFVPVGIPGELGAEADERGRFERVLPTDRDCDVRASAGDLGATPPVRLRAGRSAATVELRFARAGRIAGIVRDAGGRPAAGRHVLLDRGDGDAPPAAMTTTGADGRFELAVGGGTYTVSLVELGDTGPDRFVDRAVTVAPGGDAWVELRDGEPPAP